MTPEPDARPSTWDEAVRNFGETFVSHLLDLRPGQTLEPHDLPRRQVLAELAAPIAESHLAPEQRVSLRCSLLSRVKAGSGLTGFESARQHIGGQPAPTTGIPIEDAFCRLVYNGLAMEHIPGAEWDRFSITASFQDPVLQTPTAEAFLADPDLARLFPDAEPTVDGRGHVRAESLLTWLPAGGGTTDLRIVIGSFVEQTLARMRFNDQLREEQIVTHVRESLNQLRALARGEEVPILVLTGLLGIEVETALQRSGWGIKSATGLAVVDHSPDTKLRPRSVLWTVVPHRLVSVDRSDTDDEQVRAAFSTMFQQSVDFQAVMTRQVMTLRFAVLAWAAEQEPQQTVSVSATASWSMLPIQSSTPPWVEPAVSPAGIVTLSADDLDEVANIVREVGEVTPRLDIALGRIVRVASEQRDPVDALIDAVVSWENMLGSKAETTFKVCAALAWLLGPKDETKRRTLFAQAKKIYGLRSALVHGDVDADLNQAPALGQAALRLAVRVFRRIHADRALTDLKASSRSETILLRAHPTDEP